MTKDEFLALAGSRYDDLQRLNIKQPDFYNYEPFAKLFFHILKVKPLPSFMLKKHI